MTEVTCQECGIKWTAKRSDARFCSPACKERAKRRRLSVARWGPLADRVCLACGTVFTAVKTNKVYCTRRCSSRGWKAGLRVRAFGLTGRP